MGVSTVFAVLMMIFYERSLPGISKQEAERVGKYMIRPLLSLKRPNVLLPLKLSNRNS